MRRLRSCLFLGCSRQPRSSPDRAAISLCPLALFEHKACRYPLLRAAWSTHTSHQASAVPLRYPQRIDPTRQCAAKAYPAPVRYSTPSGCSHFQLLSRTELPDRLGSPCSDRGQAPWFRSKRLLRVRPELVAEAVVRMVAGRPGAEELLVRRPKPG